MCDQQVIQNFGDIFPETSRKSKVKNGGDRILAETSMSPSSIIYGKVSADRYMAIFEDTRDTSATSAMRRASGH